MIPLLGTVTVTRRRFAAPTFTDGFYTQATPVEVEITASLCPSPESDRGYLPDGMRSAQRIRFVTYTEVRGASDVDGVLPDQIEAPDGAVYSIVMVERGPAFLGQPEHWVSVGVQVQPLVYPGAAATAPVNLTIPTIVGTRGDGDTVTFSPGTWSGTQPISYAYRVLLDGIEVSTADEWTDDATTILQTLVVEVTATNGTAPDGVAESQPLAGTPPSVAWRSFGKIALGVSPALYDPNGILTGAPTIAADGTVTWPMGTGQTRSLPSTGAMLVVPALNVLGDPTAAYAWLWAVLRTQLMSGRYTSAPIVYGACLMTTANPATARGYGVQGSIEVGSTDSTAGVMYANNVGSWASVLAGASSGIAAVELAASRRNPTITYLSFGPCDGAGMATSGGSSSGVSLSAVDFSGGAWLGLWVGTTASDLIAGSYGTRGLAAITDVDPADFEGVA